MVIDYRFEIRQVENAKEIIDRFFRNQKNLANEFYGLLKYIKSLDSEIVLRFSSNVIGASRADSIFHFYVVPDSGKFFIKFENLQQRLIFDPVFRGSYEIYCQKTVELIKERQKLNKRSREIESILDNRGIKQLVHFTRIDNIESIVNDGLIPVKQLDAEGYKYKRNDHKRYDDQLNCTSVSVEYPNYWVLNGFQEKYVGSRWAVIVLDPTLLFDHNCYFAEYNAASKGISKNLDERTDAQSFEKMFAPIVKAITTKGTFKYPRSNLKNDYSFLPTNDQAEILVEGVIQRDYIKFVWFMSENDAKLYRGILRNKGIGAGADPEIFTTSRDNYHGFGGR